MFTQVVSNITSIEACSLDELSKDLRRMLTVQFKEFIHSIEDSEREKAKQQKYSKQYKYHRRLEMRWAS